MFTLDEKEKQAELKLFSKMQNLIIGRLLVIFLLLVASLVWNSGRLQFSFENFPRGLFLVFLISVGLTIVYFFALRLNQNYRWQLRIQFLLDALLVTWLIWRTGDISSPYITLYTVLICFASLFLGSRGTLAMTILCIVLFTTLSILAVNSYLETFSTTLQGYRVIQLVGFHNAALLIVGFLSGKLAEIRGSTETLKETEKNLADLRILHERIIQSIRSGLVTTDLEGTIFSFNAAAEEITGYKAKEKLGQSVFSLLGDLTIPIKTSLEAARKGEQPPRFEIDFLTSENLGIRLGYGISPLFSEKGETTGLIVTFQDLTEIRSMEETVRRKDRLAAVGRVAAGLAHEIRNPLGAMRGAIQVLQMQTPPESSQASLMEITLRESDRLNKIISNFLTYARPRINNFVETDICQAINDSFTLLKHSPDIKDSHILEADLPDEPLVISADSAQLKQVFWNLTRNSIQAMPNGGKLSVKVTKLDNGRVQIIFQDNGCGMLPEQVERLFEPFSDSTTGGTGLGLSIVYQIVRDHGGTINVRSLKNKGTTITVELAGDIRPHLFENTPQEVPEFATKASRLVDYLTVNSPEK